MATYTITSGQIQTGILYQVNGQQTVTYNGGTYAPGTQFRGVQGVATFTYSGTGLQSVTEVWELQSIGIGFVENALDYPVFPGQTALNSFSVQVVQNKSDLKATDTTTINSFSVELKDWGGFAAFI
jgi:hypothetical protein